MNVLVQTRQRKGLMHLYECSQRAMQARIWCNNKGMGKMDPLIMAQAKTKVAIKVMEDMQPEEEGGSLFCFVLYFYIFFLITLLKK